MRIVRGLKDLKRPSKAAVLTIGVFDGVHIGHRKVIKEAVRRAKELRLTSCVLTFDPHPLKVLRPGSRVPSLISLGHRMKLIEELGVDIIVVANFSRPFAKLSAGSFVKDILVSKLRAKEIYISEGFYFGKGGLADARTLEKIGKLFGLYAHVVKPVKIAGRIVSSSVIRKFIVNGDIDIAAKFLGRPVSILGTVVKGISLARELGYPTANINPHHEVIPPSGVYAVNVLFKGRKLNGVLNIGVRTIFFSPRDREPNIEVHIFNFHKAIYGEDLEIAFVKKLRDEVRFKNRDEMIRKIRQDVRLARCVLSDKQV